MMASTQDPTVKDLKLGDGNYWLAVITDETGSDAYLQVGQTIAPEESESVMNNASDDQLPLWADVSPDQVLFQSMDGCLYWVRPADLFNQDPVIKCLRQAQQAACNNGGE